jgi:phosphonate transport system permease protein
VSNTSGDPSEDATPDGGVEGTTSSDEALKTGTTVEETSDQPGLSIRRQFENIRLTRRRRVIGWLTLIGAIGYLLFQGAAATTLFEQELRWGAFTDALGKYFPVTSYSGIPFVDTGVPFLDLGQYIDFIIQLNLLYDPQIGGLLLQWPPDLWGFFIAELGMFSVFGQAGITLAMGFVGTLLGFPLALLFVPLASLSPVPATLAIGLNTVGNLGRLFVEDLEELEEGPIEAMQTTGAGSTQIVFFGMLSQVKTSFIAWTLYIFEINVRSAVTVGVLGAGGLGGIVAAQRAQFNFTNLMATLLCIFLLIMTVEIFSQRLRARLRSDEEKRGLWELVTGFPQRMAESAMR